MKVQTFDQFIKSDRYQVIMQRSRFSYDSVLSVVQDILDNVKRDGDQALRKYTKDFDNIDISNFRVSDKEIKIAYELVNADFLKALEVASRNIRGVAEQQLLQMKHTTVMPRSGITVWQEWKPIEKVGLYVPGGNAVYPSSVLMNAIPAKVADCKQIVMTTPPQNDGSISPYVLVAADLVGVKEIYKIGGAQAIAALIYGTESMPKVYKIFGPGNTYVVAAKQLAAANGEVAIDSPAGPSEVLVLADETANPKYVAADLVCDAEHGNDSAAVLVTTSSVLAEQVAEELERIIPRFTTQQRIKESLEKFGAIIVAKNMKKALEFANEYAAEHILISTKDASNIAEQVTNAGSVFIGEYACKSAGDYATGANHVLPTGGAAKMFSSLSIYDFMKAVEYQQVTVKGLTEIRQSIEIFAEVEQLPAHKYSCSVRFENN
ncbi:MAG: histidinol dehydrogenase [bacterium]|nr:histidinol dehydrogenase [bacterium]